MGKGRPRAVEKGVLGGPSTSASTSTSLNIPAGPVYYPTEDEFRDPLEFLDKIRPEAEQYGICRIVPPKNWKPPFCLDLNSFTFPTKTQAIHQLQGRCASCDPKTFELEYIRFLEEHCGRKTKKKVVFEGEELDLCRFFNSVKRFGGYDKVVENKKWGEVFRFVRPRGKITECAKHVLSQLYCEHLCDYEEYHYKLNQAKEKSCKRRMRGGEKSSAEVVSTFKRRRKNAKGDSIELKKREVEQRDQICEQCKSGLHGEVMLLCDRCNKGWHIYCLSPPLEKIPLGNWYCLECLNSEKDSFGFVPGKELSLEAFRRVAERAKRKMFGAASTSHVLLEKKFWEIVEGSLGKVEVMYGNDLDTSVYGSGFPRVNDPKPSSIETEIWNEYCSSPWNLNNLPKLPGSVLRAVNHEIAGVMVPWLYMGMLFSSFCWHFEDHCFYSMNYLHWGEPKCWYGVPGSEAGAFEKVMQKSLPDLFDAQPDLLFQLITMLNPSVLQENGVPVYSLLQEPGNFIITFPRSYHGGFNLGLNCAEAVNFAPADWLPHGSFGAELYQLYHKPAVLSHEELLCVVAKSEFNSKTSCYLRKELLRMYNKEKSWRERLWGHGIIRSSPLSPRKHPEFVGTEEDPVCIICQQFLYLSAVGCRCRPSVFVCLEHWEHLCECKPSKHRLLYRHTLAELNSLVLMTEESNRDDPCKSSPSQLASSNESVDLSRKVKGRNVSYLELAKEWQVKSCKILKNPYSQDSYANALKEAEQFLWGGSEMNPVRDMEKKLADARNWTEAVKDCFSKVKSYRNNNKSEKVGIKYISALLSSDLVPCNEPYYLKLKKYEEEAKTLIQEIEQALAVSSIASFASWEALCAKASASPIYVKESKRLLKKLSSTKRWVKSVRKLLDKKSTSAIEADALFKLKSELLELHIQLPEVEMFLDLISQVEQCRSRCGNLLEGPICPMKLESLVREYDGFKVIVPELKLLRECHADAVSWIGRANRVLVNIHSWDDQENVVDELTSLQKDGMSLKVQVEELPKIDAELKKACCRVKALKALRCKMHIDVVKQLIEEATIQQIEKETLFLKISDAIAAADQWEDRAKHLLANEGEMSDFEDVLRNAEDMVVILPSLEDVKAAVAKAKCWLSKSDQFLLPNTLLGSSSLMLKVDELKELVSESKLLKISLRERDLLQRVLKKCMEFDQDAHFVLRDTLILLDSDFACNEIPSGLEVRVNSQILSLESIIDAGLSHSFEFPVIAKLQDACSSLKWCSKGLRFCNVVPTLEEVRALEVSGCLPTTYASSALCALLVDGVNWLKKALEVLPPRKGGRMNLHDAEEVLGVAKKVDIQFPLMIGQLQNAIEKHDLWLDQVHLFFGLKCHDRSWSSLLNLKDLGIADAFNCSELDLVLAEVKKVEQWNQHCKDIIRAPVGDMTLLNDILLEVKSALDRSFSLYKEPECCRISQSCVCCSSNTDKQRLVTCSTCDDCFHVECGRLLHGEDGNLEILYICAYCNFLKSGKISRGNGLLKTGQKFTELKKLIDLLSEAEELCLWTDERKTLHQVVEKATACSACLMELVDDVLSYHGGDLSIVAQKLTLALKALNVGGVSDNQCKSKFDLALARNSWKIRALNLSEGSRKPTVQQIQRHLKEGAALSIPEEDFFIQRLSEMRQMGLQWMETAKKVSTDGGLLELDKVFQLVAVGEDLPVLCDKELKLLKDRTMLYCICRKPYDQRPMIACDRCDEWYHFDCVKLSSVPRVYICPACDCQTEDLYNPTQTMQERSTNAKVEEPQTPSPGRTELWRKSANSNSRKKEVALDMVDTSSSIVRLMWTNRKPFRRLARKRANLSSLSLFCVDT